MCVKEFLLEVLEYIVSLDLDDIVSWLIVIPEILKRMLRIFKKIKGALISLKIFLRARIFHAWIKANQKAIISSVDEFFDIARDSFDLSK